jgi:hypothetical protein
MRPSSAENSAFVPRDWNAFFSGLTADERRTASARVCRAVLAVCPPDDPSLHDEPGSLEQGIATAPHADAVTAVVERLQADYDRLIGDDEGKLLHRDPVIKDVFQKARAASVVKFALEGRLTEMAYEAWFVLDDLDEIRRLIGMSHGR